MSWVVSTGSAWNQCSSWCLFEAVKRWELGSSLHAALCQIPADIAVLAEQAERGLSNLRAFNGGGATNSVPGHHHFKHLQVARIEAQHHLRGHPRCEPSSSTRESPIQNSR